MPSLRFLQEWVDLRSAALDAGASRGDNSSVAQILIIEDDIKTATAICEGLRMDGHEAVAAPTGQEGARLCQSRPFDVIVLDWILPERSGIDQAVTALIP